jgi:hypothetical protein
MDIMSRSWLKFSFLGVNYEEKLHSYQQAQREEKRRETLRESGSF